MKKLLELAIRASEAACKEILSVYDSGDFQTESKGDNSPLTRADKKAHDRIVSILQPSNLPVLSEEGKNISYEERKNWQQFWMVDPLDGTKEFLKRNGEFTVNVALIENQKPVLGVVAVPVTGDVFYAEQGLGANVKRMGRVGFLPKRLSVDITKSGIRVVASRSHMNADTETYIQSLKKPVLVSQGSSLKFMLLAEGKADLYPRFAPSMEWDTAAAHAIVSEVGFSVLQKDTNIPLLYNKPDLLNPSFICQ